MKKSTNIIFLIIFCLIISLIAGCGSENNDKTTAKQQEIYVLAAASMTDAIQEIGANYEKEHKNIKLVYSFGSSGALQTQIEQGAPADVFISAAQKQMNVLDKKDLLDKSTRKDLVENKIVLIVPTKSNLKINSLSDLASDKVTKIALGEPNAVPVGQYSEEIFSKLNILDNVKSKAVYASDVRQVLSWVETGEVDCGLVYATDAAISDKVKVLFEAPGDTHKPIIYPVAMLKSSSHQEEAKDFINYLTNNESKTVLEKYGFTPSHADYYIILKFYNSFVPNIKINKSLKERKNTYLAKVRPLSDFLDFSKY